VGKIGGIAVSGSIGYEADKPEAKIARRCDRGLKLSFYVRHRTEQLLSGVYILFIVVSLEAELIDRG